jgi:stress-induced morphogen
MPTADEIKQRIERGIPGAAAAVDGPDGVHFEAAVTADAFAGLTRIQQHRMVMDIFAGELGGSIHALSLKTKIPS